MPRATLTKLVVLLWSFGWTLVVGHLGIFAFDQSIVFDGGWRVLAGQVPFKDFIGAFGTVAFLVQAAFFKIFGVNWTAAVLAAAVLGVVATLSVMRTMSLLFGKERHWLAAWCGLLVGTSFQAMFGTLAVEQMAFLPCLLGVQVVCESTHGQRRHRFLYLGSAGILAVLSFLSKQNVGALTIVLLGSLVTLASLPEPRKVIASVSEYLIGIGLAVGVFALWLVLFSNPDLFVRHALEVPSGLAGARVDPMEVLFLPTLLRAPKTTSWCYAVALGAAFQALVLVVRDREFRRIVLAAPSYRLAIGLALAIPFMRSLFQIATLNQPENVIFLSGFALALGIGLFQMLPSTQRREWIPALACFISVFLLFEMVSGAWNRTMHDAFPQGSSNPFARLHAPPLAHVRWISPTRAGTGPGRDLEPQDIDAVFAYLTASNQDFLLLGDSTYLYGICGVEPPLPLLYLEKDHFYTERDVPLIDSWTLSNLQQREIRIVVRQKKSFLYWLPLPRTMTWVEENFHPGPTFGNFEILLRGGVAAVPWIPLRPNERTRRRDSRRSRRESPLLRDLRAHGARPSRPR